MGGLPQAPSRTMTWILPKRSEGHDHGGRGGLLLLRVIRILAGGIGFAMLAVLPLIALNLARFGEQVLTRFRGPTYILWLQSSSLFLLDWTLCLLRLDSPLACAICSHIRGFSRRWPLLALRCTCSLRRLST